MWKSMRKKITIFLLKNIYMYGIYDIEQHTHGNSMHNRK